MIVAVVGSREGVNLDVVQQYVEALHEKYPTCTVVSGGARGVDTTAELTAFKLGHEIVSLRPVEIHSDLFVIERWMCAPSGDLWEDSSADYGEFDSFAAAASRRNHEVVKLADVVVAFTAGTRGTANAVSEARRQGKELFLYDSQGGKL